MKNGTALDAYDDIDLSIALNALHKLALQEGDLGRDYWRQISELLKDSASFRQRALIAEEQLRRRLLSASKQLRADRRVGMTQSERKRIAREFPRDIARMQGILMAAGKDYQIDEMILAWSEHSSQVGGVWMTLPKSDEELLLMLLGAIDP